VPRGKGLAAADTRLLRRLAKAGKRVPFSERIGDPFALYQRGLVDISHANNAAGSMTITEAGRRALEEADRG
jgi:hypothetical protein